MQTSKLELSKLTHRLLAIYQKETPQKYASEELLDVSQTISFFAVLLEKLRTSVEFVDEHLIRRAAIERILRRRLLLNENAVGIAELLIKELLWARYLPNHKIPKKIVAVVQDTIDKYFYLKSEIVPGRPKNETIMLENFLIEVASCEIEAKLAPDPKRDAFTNYVYHILSQHIEVKDASGEETNVQDYIAVDRAFAKSDEALVRYHLLHLYFSTLSVAKWKDVTPLVASMYDAIMQIEKAMNNPVGDKLVRFVKREMPPFLILREVFEQNDPKKIEEILKNTEALQRLVDSTCRKRYSAIGDKLRRTGVRSIIYIFLTKMLFALLIEYPYDKYVAGMVDYLALGINATVPPAIMFLIVGFTSPPGADNTKRIFDRIRKIITTDDFTGKKITIVVKEAVRRPILSFIFSLIYAGTFLLSFGLIVVGLTFLNFSIVSQLIFIFFVSVVVFFGYRIRQTANEYRLTHREGVLSPIVDFFIVPILNLGKWLSNEIARFGPLTLITLVFDIIIEAPFKAIFEIAEEWVAFARAKKDEIV